MTPAQIEKLAQWVIDQENKILAEMYPICPEIAAMSDDELYRALIGGGME